MWRLLREIMVQRRYAAREAITRVLGTKHVNAKSGGHLESAINRLRTLTARFMPALSGGGSSSILAKRCWSSMDIRVICAPSVVWQSSFGASATRESLTLRS